MAIFDNIDVGNSRAVIIIRASSGAGKSTFASFIQSLYPKAVICCADDYFYDKHGNYNFNASQLGAAHLNCKKKFEFSLDNGAECVIVSNTNVKSSEWKYYHDLALERGYKVFFLVIENRHGGKDCHGLSQETLKRQKETILKNISL